MATRNKKKSSEGKLGLWLEFVICVVGLYSSRALSTTLGPPIADLKAGQFSAGFDYSHTDIDIETDAKQLLLIDKEIVGSSQYDPLDTLKSDMKFTNIGYGISEKYNVFLRLGVAESSIDEGHVEGYRHWEWEGDDEFAFGFGAKATLFEKANCKLGALFQMAWLKSEGDMRYPEYIGETVYVNGTNKLKWFQMKLAVGPAYQLTERTLVYGGPFFYLVHGDYDAEGTTEKEVLGSLYDTKLNGEFEARSYGVYLGAQIDIAENLPISVEYQFTNGHGVLGTSLLYRF